MNITPRQRRSAVWAFIIIMLLLLIVFLLLFLRGSEVVPDSPMDGVDNMEVSVTDTTPSAKVVVPVTAEAASARVVATNFAERFGTYSTDAAFANVNEVRELSTPEYYNELLGTVSDITSDTFTGVSSRVLSVTLESGSEDLGEAVYVVSVQNEVERGSRSNATVEYKTALITVEKRGESWLVSNFQWN